MSRIHEDDRHNSNNTDQIVRRIPEQRRPWLLLLVFRLAICTYCAPSSLESQKANARRDSKITSFQTSLPLSLQVHQTAGFIVCFAVMLGIYYTDVWDAKSLPFMSTSLRQANGTVYPSADVFPNGNLDHDALETYGIPRMTGTFAYSMLMANAAVSNLRLPWHIFPD